MTRFGSDCAAQFSNFRLIDFQHDKETAQIIYSRVIYSQKGLGDLVIDLKIDVSNYSFNIPLTIALVAVLLPMVKWSSRAMVEVLILLLFIHFAYIFFYTSLQLFYYSHPNKTPSLATLCNKYFLEFMWTFIDNMVVRFEPFLVALYLVFRKPRTKVKKKANTLIHIMNSHIFSTIS